MRSSLFKVLAVGGLLALLAGCGSAPESVAPGKVLILGGIVSKTGAAAAYGEEVEKGIRLAIEEVNASGGPFSIRYIDTDDASDKTEAVKVARTLIDLHRVHAIVGPIISPSALTVGKLAEERQVPMVTPSATQDDITSSATYDRQYVSRVCFDDSYQGLVLAQFAARSLGKRRAAIVYDRSLSYSIGLARTFKEQFEILGGTVVAEENYSVRDSDFSVLVKKVATFDAEILFIPGWDEHVGPMLKQAGDQWKRFTLLGGDGWPSRKLLELAGGNLNKVYAVSHFSEEDPNPRVQAFRQAYRKRYRGDASPYAALGYDAARLIALAARQASSFSGPDLKDAINSSKDVTLVTGTITFDENRNPRKDVVIVKIEPNRILFHERVRA